MTIPAPRPASDDPNPCTDSALLHPECVVCASSNPRGLALKFVAPADGRGVETTFECHDVFQGYNGLVHGGTVSAVLDGARAHEPACPNEGRRCPVLAPADASRWCSDIQPIGAGDEGDSPARPPA
jgi:hypothetical protein